MDARVGLPAPWFFVVSVTSTGRPAPPVAGADSEERNRSGPITILVERVLFATFASVVELSAFAFAIT